jgi:hypothetical protein
MFGFCGGLTSGLSVNNVGASGEPPDPRFSLCSLCLCVLCVKFQSVAL